MSGFSKQPPGRRMKTLIIEDDCDTEAQDESNPFSFKEFIKSKTPFVQAGKVCDERPSKESAQSSRIISGPRETASIDYQETFFKDPTADHDLLNDEEDDEEEEDWSESYHPSIVEQSHNPGTSPESVYNNSCGYSDISGVEDLTWSLPVGISSSMAASCTRVEPPAKGLSGPVEDLFLQSLQFNYEKAQEENCYLKRKIGELKELNESQAEKVKHLERKLEEKILEEQKEAQDLESMVQQVEANLQMMTKRALKAESNVTKLRQEVTLLQVQLNTYKAENEALRRGETTGMIAVKQNANLALENLHKVVSGAQASIKQLVSGADALHLVAELLRSIDKIAEVNEDVP